MKINLDTPYTFPIILLIAVFLFVLYFPVSQCYRINLDNMDLNIKTKSTNFVKIHFRLGNRLENITNILNEKNVYYKYTDDYNGEKYLFMKNEDGELIFQFNNNNLIQITIENSDGRGYILPTFDYYD